MEHSTRTEKERNVYPSGCRGFLKQKLREQNIGKEQVIGVGVGVAGQVSEEGVVLFAENLGWEQVPLTKELSRLTGLSFRAENDANIAALGELWKAVRPAITAWSL